MSLNMNLEVEQRLNNILRDCATFGKNRCALVRRNGLVNVLVVREAP